MLAPVLDIGRVAITARLGRKSPLDSDISSILIFVAEVRFADGTWWRANSQALRKEVLSRTSIAKNLTLPIWQ